MAYYTELYFDGAEYLMAVVPMKEDEDGGEV